MKPIIYQLFPRTFSNYNETRKHNGTKAEIIDKLLVSLNEG